MNADILISIVIPVKNGDYWLDALFRKLMAQTLFHQAEIIVIDSGSDDKSLDIASQYPVRLIQIPPSSFNHGETRNLGVRESKGKYIVFTVQDALPEKDTWLEDLLDGFDDENVAGVCGQQIVPHEPDKNPIVWFRPVNGPGKTKYVFKSKEEFENLTPAEKKNYCGWDDVNAIYRSDILKKIPFRKIPFAEDARWAVDALSNGYSIVYTSFAKVYHYHYDSPAVIYKRVFEECYARYVIFGFITNTDRSFRKYLRDVKLLLRDRRISFSKKIKWFLYNFRIRAAANRAIIEFNKCIALGEDQLHRRYAEICGSPQHALAPVLNDR